MVKRKECKPFPRSYLWDRRTVGSAAGEPRWSHTTRWERRSVRPEKVKEGQVDSERRGNTKKLDILRNQKGWSLLAEKNKQPTSDIVWVFSACFRNIGVEAWRSASNVAAKLLIMATQQWRDKSSLFSLWIVVKWLNDTGETLNRWTDKMVHFSFWYYVQLVITTMFFFSVSINSNCSHYKMCDIY